MKRRGPGLPLRRSCSDTAPSRPNGLRWSLTRDVVMTQGQYMDPNEAFGELGRVKLDEVDLDAMLTRIAQLAKRTIPHTHEVSVTLVGGDDARTAACTGELALTLDEWQYQLGYGPCLDAS